MPALAFDDFDALEDPLAVDRFGILIEPSTNAGLNAVLALRCLQMAVPEEMLEVMPVAIQGMEFNFRGRRTYDKTIGAAYVETRDVPVTKGLRSWLQATCGSASHNGVYKRQYATLGTIEVYDVAGAVGLSIGARNLWLSQIPAVQLEGSTAQQYTQQATYTYDKFVQDGVEEK